MEKIECNVISNDTDLQFKRSIIGWILVVLNIFVALGATHAFLVQFKIGLIGWLMMNSCTPAVALLAAGFFTRSLIIMVASAIFMFRYGTAGLFVFGWDVHMIGAQIGHILMTLAGIYILISTVQIKAWKKLRKGILIGSAILVPYMLIQEIWSHSHPELIEKFMSGELMVPIN